MRAFFGICALLGTTVLVSACDEKKADAPSGAASTKPATSAPAATSAATAAASAAPTASASAAPATSGASATGKPFAERMSCEAILPEKARAAAGLLNYKMTQQTTCAECGPTCNLVKPDNPFGGMSIAFTCNAAYDKAAADKLIAETKAALRKSAPVTGGRGGIMGEKDNGTFYSAVAYDDDSDCKVAVDWMRGDKKSVEPVIKMALAGVKQADVDAAKKK